MKRPFDAQQRTVLSRHHKRYLDLAVGVASAMRTRRALGQAGEADEAGRKDRQTLGALFHGFDQFAVVIQIQDRSIVGAVSG
jgi:hypothetical protein